MLWLLGLPCQISYLQLIDDCLVTSDMLRDVLDAARGARKLSISFYKFSLFLDEKFIRAFAEGCEITQFEYELAGANLDLGDVLVSI